MFLTWNQSTRCSWCYFLPLWFEVSSSRSGLISGDLWSLGSSVGSADSRFGGSWLLGVCAVLGD
ncbi:hypothetical protein HanLR1_Chr13g0477671 [Helianthus annuus]|nr:hypothetical protein HanLR1_Chr13g0477671 [Helianthus annuus]